MKLFLGALLGFSWAVADAWILWRGMKAARRQADRAGALIARTLLGRYLLAGGVLAFALLFNRVDAVGVILPLILQKAILVAAALIVKKKEPS